MKYAMTASLLASLLGSLVVPRDGTACTRVVYKGPEQTVLTGRTMDFSIDIPANLGLFPRGMKRSGQVGPNSIEWTSAFEKGGDQQGLTIAAWAQYVLDNFATVAEAVEDLRKEEFVIVTDFIPGTDKFTTVHLSLSDATGDSAILEYVDGKLVIHHDPAYQVMTNDPVFEQQRAIQGYWDDIPGSVFLPGTNRASDRFVRASYYIQAIPQTSDPKIVVPSVFSVIRNVSVPYGISTDNQPHISSTRWRVVADQKRLVYYFENVLTPNVLWVDLKKIDFSAGSAVRKLPLDDGQVYAGDASEHFEEAAPFEFQGL